MHLLKVFHHAIVMHTYSESRIGIEELQNEILIVYATK